MQNNKLFNELIAKLIQEYRIEDIDPIRVALASYIAHHFISDPIWPLFIAPPSSFKTELLHLFSALPDTYPLSDLTEKTLLSGFEGGKHSLIYKLNGKILILKDFTTVISMRRERRAEILAQLREIYDGSIKKAFGTGAVVDWKGKVGLMAGVTPVIDAHYAIFKALGERFIQVRLLRVDELEMGKKAIKNIGQESELRKYLPALVKTICEEAVEWSTTQGMPTITEPFQWRLSALASITVKARSHIARNNYSKDIEYSPEPEAPARLAKQLASLAQGLASLRRSNEVSDCDFQIVKRVAFDCMPIIRAKALQAIINGGQIGAAVLARQVGVSEATAKRAMEDMRSLSLLDDSIDPQGLKCWGLSANAKKLIEIAFPTCPPGGGCS